MFGYETSIMSIRDKLPTGSPLGFGRPPLGNMFCAIPDAEEAATARAAWEQGTRFFDTAPFYGSGLAELRLGEWLPEKPRESYAISTKVGRSVLDEMEDPTAREPRKESRCFCRGSLGIGPSAYSVDARRFGRRVEDSNQVVRVTNAFDRLAPVHDAG